MAQDYTNMSVQDKLKLADERLEKLKGTDKYDAFKERVDAMHAKYGSAPETYTWADQKLNNKVEAYEFDAKAHGRVDKNGEADVQKDPLPMLDEWVVLGNGGDKYGVSERGLMTRPIPKFFTQPTKPPSPDELADSYREATKPLDYLRLKRGGTVDELVASFKVMKRGLGTTQAAKGGEAPDLTGMSNFLATDKVPDTIFGIPIVSRCEDYTEADIAFFKEHPEAGGYYDMGEDGENASSEVQGMAGAPAATEKGGDAFASRANTAVTDVIDFLRSHEGFRSDAYRDTEGVPTIGYGQTNILNRAVTMDDHGMSEPEARKWMERRVRENAVNLYKRHPWMQKLSTGALAAAYDLAYNMGDGVFTKTSSPRFNRRLDAGEDPETVFWSELPTYVGGKDADAQTRKGLKNRRNDAIKRWKGVK